MRLIAFKFALLFLFSVSAHSQLRHTSHYYKKTGWLCGEFIILDSTGLFFRESGCEGQQEITFGRYRVSKSGRLNVNFLSLDSLAPIRQIRQMAEVKDSFITVRFVDRKNQPVPTSFGVVLIDTAGKAEDAGSLDKGTLLFDRFRYRQILLAQLGSPTRSERCNVLPVGTSSAIIIAVYQPLSGVAKPISESTTYGSTE